MINYNTQEIQQLSKNKFDKLVIGIPYNHLNLSNMKNKTDMKIGVNITRNVDQVIVNISGKPFATPNDIGYIQNLDTFSEDLTNFTGIEFDTDYLLNEAPVFENHVTIDIDRPDPCGDLSLIREILKNRTDKWDIYRYGNLKYLDGLAVVPKTKEKVRLIIYCKGVELRNSKNKEFRKIFSGEYLERTRNMLRFEYQIRDFKHTREAYGLGKSEVPTIAALFCSQRNVVADIFDRLID